MALYISWVIKVGSTWPWPALPVWGWARSGKAAAGVKTVGYGVTGGTLGAPAHVSGHMYS